MTASGRARESLNGLALGDGFGERWFPLFRSPQQAFDAIQAREVPAEAPWYWTDDTAMALCVLRVLDQHGEVQQDRLAALFAGTYRADPARGYGSGMHELLPRLAVDATCWRHQARSLFGGQGSLGNGAAMRIAPLGAWFGDDLGRVAEQAALAAEVTHAHPEGIAGAVAVALAAALAAGSRDQLPPQPEEFLHEVADRTPKGAVREGLHRAAELPAATAAWQAADILGNGQRIRADDTVPFAVWSAAWHLDDLVDALWSTAEGLGDVDTTCAITGGVVAARTGVGAVPQQWLDCCEPLPDWVSQDQAT